MRLKIIILILALFAFLSALAGGVLYFYSFRKAAFQQSEAAASKKLELLSDQVSFYLSEHIKPVSTLSGIKELKSALEKTSLETIYQANQILDHFNRSLDLEVTYLMNASGVTLCSSNRNDADSFVGKDFSFRPYCEKALKGSASTYLALGTTSGKRGVYYSHPVRNDTGRIIGVAVMKASVEFVETKLFPQSEDLLLFVSPDGIIFISSEDNFKFKSLWELNEEQLDLIQNSRQFGNGPWAWSGFSEDGPFFLTRQKGTRYRVNRSGVINYPKWRIFYLQDNEKLTAQVLQPFARVVGPAVSAVLLLCGALLILLYQLGIREISRRKKAEKDLRLSEKRYRRIYHKTPVMLHSIDTKGRIIQVSDHWVEVMGYERQDVIGRQLIRFFTKESQRYAVDKVFPEFFSTGFCKDIPYTYIKKNGETMDIMLSCYGLRDDDGTITRSLAVSVDVTEKNRVQQDLQIAKEKLSRYSQDLEQQVKKRTAQLESAQENLKTLSKNIIASQEREKAIVARELHDHLGQVLTALRIDAVWARQKLQTFGETEGQRAQTMCSLIDNTINDIRDMAYRLRPRVLDDLGLTDALESLLTDFENRTNVSCVFKHDDISEIDETISTALYRIGQEAITNSLKHSNATTVIVELKTDKDGIILTIQDNGCGFDPDSRFADAQGFGLEGMKERAQLVGGKLDIISDPSTGTTVCCKVSVKG